MINKNNNFNEITNIIEETLAIIASSLDLLKSNRKDFRLGGYIEKEIQNLNELVKNHQEDFDYSIFKNEIELFDMIESILKLYDQSHFSEIGLNHIDLIESILNTAELVLLDIILDNELNDVTNKTLEKTLIRYQNNLPSSNNGTRTLPPR